MIIGTATQTPETFLLTRLLRGVTIIFESVTTIETISTHTPLARRDAVDRGKRITS